MSLEAAVQKALDQVGTITCGPLRLCATAVSLDDDGALRVGLQLFQYDQDEVVGIKEQECLFAPAGTEPSRAVAFVEGWARALPMLVQRESKPDWLEPVELICPLAFDVASLHTARDFEAALLDPSGPYVAWRKQLALENGAVDADAYAEFLVLARPEGADGATARRDQARERAEIDGDELEAKLQRVYGLRLPRQVRVFWAFFLSLSPAERAAYDTLVGFSPAGILDWIRSDRKHRTPRDGLDERLHWRYRCDPPELVSVLHGISDAQHFGLFYDDPARLPAGVVVNYARDSAETWWASDTLLGVIRNAVQREADFEEPDPCQKQLLLDALDAFADDDQTAADELIREAPMPLYERRNLPAIVNGVGVLGRDRTPTPIPYLANGPHAVDLRDAAQVRGWIEEARAALQAGDPLYALALGRDLHWLDADEHREAGHSLLVGAYEALGRTALVDLARLHHAHRDLASVDVYRT